MAKAIHSSQRARAKKPGLAGCDAEFKCFGWLPDHPDPRDLQFAALHPPMPGAGPLPAAVDLSPTMSPVENQGNSNSCTGNSTAGALEYLLKKEGKKFYDISRLFLYYNGRWAEGYSKFDSGAYIRDVIKAVATWGAASESLWPFNLKKITTRPSDSAFAFAAKHKIKTYSRLNTPDEMRQCLAEGYPFVFGFTVFAGFMSTAVAKTGHLEMPTASEGKEGGHAVLCVGYDDATQRFLVRNSWGDAWGMKGYFTMPYAYLADPNLASDFWTIRL